MNPYFTKRFSVFFSAFLFLLTGFMVSAWTGPTGTAPANNVSAPINVGTTNQVKSANLGVNGLAVFGNSLLQGSSYLNWGTTAGTAGYGIYDNAGVLNFKNSGGSWQSLQAIVSGLVGTGSQWTTSGSDIYYNGGNVGIGVTPSYRLQVNGAAGNWTEVLNWPPGSVNAYGILVGTGAGKYSQFQNAEGYYTMLANSSWGVYTNGNIYTSGYFQGTNSFGGLFGTILETGSCNWPNPLTGGCSCPGYAPYAAQADIGYHGSGYSYLYQCY